MDLISRAEAKAAGQSWYYTGKPCKHGHITKRWTRDGICSECKSARNKKWWSENKERGRALVYKWRALNSEKHRQSVNTSVRAWSKVNAGKRNSYTAHRRALLLRATPPWADKDAIRNLYVKAKESGMHVDHIVPLNSAIVCGLHVIFNLQMLSPRDNLSKSNSFYENI